MSKRHPTPPPVSQTGAGRSRRLTPRRSTQDNLRAAAGWVLERTLASLSPRPVTVGVSFTHGFLPFLRSEPDDLPLDALITEDGVMWQRP